MSENTKANTEISTSVDDIGNNEEHKTSNKRRRIGIACDSCRIRKSRCSGARPKCNQCDRLGFDCVYETPESAANIIIPKDLFAELEHRVQKLEDTISHLMGSHSSQTLREDHSKFAPSLRKSSSTVSTQSKKPSQLINTISVHIDDVEDSDQGKTDGMATTVVNEENPIYFGPSSNIAFMRHIFGALSSMRCPNAESATSAKDNILNLNLQKPMKGGENLGMENIGLLSAEANVRANCAPDMLPSYTEMEELLKAYFSNTGLLFPYIHKDSFFATYYQLKDQGFTKGAHRTWVGLLNIVLAMAVSTASPNAGYSELEVDAKSISKAEVFYRRAKQIYSNHILHSTSLDTVQCLLLTVQYLQGTQRSSQMWITHGLAIQAALTIGLQSKSLLNNFSPIEQEMRIRTWYGCIILDRSLSMTFGRPCLLQEYCHAPSLPKSISSSSCEDASVSFFRSTITLYQMAYKILQSLYGNNSDCDTLSPPQTPLNASIYGFSRELAQWKLSLPNRLFIISISDIHSSSGQSTGDIEERYRVILTLRFLYTQLLLHRPVMSLSLANSRPTGETAYMNVINQSERSLNLACACYAKEIISIVHLILTERQQGRRIVGAWWFTLYYVFNAALVVFGSLLIPLDTGDCESICSHQRAEEGEEVMEKAVHALLCLDDRNSTVRRCVWHIQYLLSLLQKWMKDNSGPLSSSQTPYIPASQFPAAFMNLNSPPFDSLVLPPTSNSQGNSRVPHSILDFSLGDITTPINNMELGPFFSNEFQNWFYGSG